MNDVITLLKPRFWGFKNGSASTAAKSRKLKFLVFGLIGTLFWVGTFTIFYRVLSYFQGAKDFGDILAGKLLSMVIVTFFALLIFSSIITSLSKFYLSRDLTLVHSLPVSPGKIFMARWIESTLDSSWMVIIYSLPIFLSYGIVYNAGAFFCLIVTLAVLSLCMIASAMSSITIIIIAMVLPAGRLRVIFVFLGLIVFLILLFAFRMMRPEQFVDPDAFSSLLLYFRSLQTPGSPWLPTTWIFDSIHTALSGQSYNSLFHLSLSWSFAITLIFAMSWIASGSYFTGFSKAQTTPAHPVPMFVRKGLNLDIFMGFLSKPVRAFVIKEIKTFFRDQTQWPQIFLIMALIAIYLYNYYVLPLENYPTKIIYLQNIFSFLNMGLTAFVLTAIASRFVFPGVSIEGEAFWIIKAAPVSLKTFLWIKFFIYYFPLLILSEVLVVVSNLFLHVAPFMMVLSAFTIFLVVPAIIAMGVGMGAMFPDFKSENPAQAVTSFGGLLFMMLCAGFIGIIILIEAGPIYSVFMANIRGKDLTTGYWIWFVVSFSLILILCILATIIPMRLGERYLRQTM
jgi:ABC-2 type transport system permease protein